MVRRSNSNGGGSHRPSEEQEKKNHPYAVTKREFRDRDIEILRTYLLDEDETPLQSTTTMTATVATTTTADKKNGTTSSKRTTADHGKTSSNGKTYSNNSTPSTTNDQKKHRFFFLSLLRTLLLDTPLMILFSLLLSVYCLRTIHDDYFLPMLEAAERTDDDLNDEFTYYERSCTGNDLSTRNVSELLLTNSSTPQQAVDTFMRHGSVVLPQLLRPTTVTQLREYIVKRNAALTDVEKIPLSQGRNRLSFAIDASEDPIVSQAVGQVARHPLLKPMLEELIGKDPAVAELTAITAYYNCPHQAWHQDVKEDGSPLKYGRTYTHSHSLFIALQDTTEAMGATTLCPGTHYCPNEGMAETCETLGIPLSQASEDNIWHSGDGALLSQQVWHRGAKHSDETAPERIVLIMSFLARPSLVEDGRQLSRGTYFHQRWNMWGHTFENLKTAATSMAKPWSVLRCLGIYKPPQDNWGYDLMTASILRMANNQQGVTYEELEVFVDTVMSPMVPQWLQGPVTTGDDAWQVYLRDTLDNCVAFFTKVNLYVMGAYLVVMVVMSALTRKTSIVKGTLVRLLVTHGVLLALAFALLRRVQQTPWARDITAHRMLTSAFPQDAVLDDMSIVMGPTALPERHDVLVGTRLDAKFLGAFDRWLDYHPGNVVFQTAVAESADSYASYSGLVPVFSHKIVTNIVSTITRRGRFLQQDYRSGVWRLMSDAESRDYARVALLSEHSKLLKVLNKQVAYMLADYRFGLKRSTAMARDSQVNLLNWRNKVLFPRNESELASASAWPANDALPTLVARHSPLPEFTSHARPDVTPKEWLSVPQENDAEYEPGDLVMTFYQDSEDDEGKWFRSAVVKVRSDNRLRVSYDDGGLQTVDSSLVRPLVPIEEGVRVQANWGGGKEVFGGTVTWVHPNGCVDIVYDDGDIEDAVPPHRYEVIS